MCFHFSLAARIRDALVVVSAAALVSGCSVNSGTRKASYEDPAQETEYLNAAESRQDPYRIICRRYQPTGSHSSDKICMTGRQWQSASDDAAGSIDRARRTTEAL